MMSITIDYDDRDCQLISRILQENSRRLSRTTSGFSNTQTHSRKLPLRFTGESLKEKARENEHAVGKWIYATRNDPPPHSRSDVLTLIWKVCDGINAELLPTKERLRCWPIGTYQKSLDGSNPSGRTEPKLDPDRLPEAMDRYADVLLERWSELSTEPVPLAAWAEWQLNGGPLHPFYDGCGRISRAYSAMLLVRGRTLLPIYDSLNNYFDHGHQGETAFADYMREGIRRCENWLAETA